MFPPLIVAFVFRCCFSVQNALRLDGLRCRPAAAGADVAGATVAGVTAMILASQTGTPKTTYVAQTARYEYESFTSSSCY